MTIEWWQVLLGAFAGIGLIWLALVTLFLVFALRHPLALTARDLVRLVPDVARLLKRLVMDRSVPIGVRLWLIALLVYLLSPIDLIPDFVPLIGFADDAIAVVIAIRFATRRAGVEAIERHWPGTADGLLAVLALAGLRAR